MADPFITEDELGTYVGRDLSADDAATLAIQGACAMCRTVAEQTFTQVTDDEIVLDGSGSDALVLPELPATAVESVTVNDTVTDTDDYVLTSNGVIVRPGGYWRRGRQNITVVYTHGYPADQVPADLKLVALSIASRLLDQGNVQQESIGSYRVTYSGAATDLTAGERAVLAKYRRN